ncbi:MAG: hypothetical protein JWO02_1062 [Solirubrobacterales bacterium]|nr:hypothetical protein [Solirubrobacterales bacterium]
MLLSRKDRTRPTAPTKVRAGTVQGSQVTIAWRAAHDDVKVTAYEVWRDGKRLARTSRTRYTDRTLAPGKTYRYVIRARDAAGNLSKAGKAIVVKVPAAKVTQQQQPSLGTGAGPAAGTEAGPGGTQTPGGTPTTVPPVTPTGSVLTRAMVDRMFWRAGFGPSEAERTTWTGRGVDDLVDFFLTAPQTLDQTVPPPVSQTNQPIDPTASRNDLVMEWLDTMQRAGNPFTERLTFFWHRHWAVSDGDGLTHDFLIPYRDRLRKYGDLAAHPHASFKTLAEEMTTADGAMSYFLTGYANQKGSPNENYAREFMELFCLGVRDAAGTANYSQQDVQELARAFTGWRLDQNPNSPTFTNVSFGGPSYHDAGTKTIFGQAAKWGAIAGTPAGAVSAIDLVLAHPAHAPFLIRKLWAEFVVSPLPDATLAELAATYTAGGAYELAPLLRKILSHPLIFESLDEPNMVKPPVVYLVGAQRQLGAPMKWFWQREALANMQQIPYSPPNVAGWEGGLSWLNTNTTQARFDLILRLLMLKHKPSPTPTSGSGFPGSVPIAAPPPGEGAQQAFDTAYAACTSPWLSDATKTQLVAFAGTHPHATSDQRLQRQYTLRALILGGPDGQVM